MGRREEEGGTGKVEGVGDKIWEYGKERGRGKEGGDGEW